MERIEYYDIAEPSVKVDLRTAVLSGTGSINGLYMPVKLPRLPGSFFDRLRGMDLKEIALTVSARMFGNEIPEPDLYDIISRALSFEIPLVRLDKGINVLELFHGPTLAFKDTGARFMASLLEYFVGKDGNEVTVLVATSGDTGSAVAHAFSNCPGVQVVILFPSGRVSKVQEQMLLPAAANIHTLEVEGDFDDCQKIVKQAFSDRALRERLNLISANSINFARLFPQSFYYFKAVADLEKVQKPVVFSIPCGNFGNLTAGVMAQRMGLGVDRFIASCNSNHPVVTYLNTGIYSPGESVKTITNAMDVGNPSNFPRLLELFGNRYDNFQGMISGYWYNDGRTKDGIKELNSGYGYLADPHTAISYLGLRDYMSRHDCEGIFISTAHPVKFEDVVELATGSKVPVPAPVEGLANHSGHTLKMAASYDDIKDYLITL
ncbi:MAG TPA: threonine synthase [Bacteroidales bacterium]|nr:threonine synthase [Bacteroidales bacterium]